MVEAKVVRWYGLVEHRVGPWESITILASSRVSIKLH